MRSCHQWSRPACIGTCSPVRRTTTTFSTDLQPPSFERAVHVGLQGHDRAAAIRRRPR